MKPADRLRQRLAAGELAVIDGGMGTELEALGAEMDDNAWCALANIQRPDLVQHVHQEFINAGADVVITNTFPAGRPVLEAAGCGERFEDVNRAAVAAALRAREHTGRPVVVAGAIGGLPTAADMTFRFRGLSADRLREAFAEQAMLLADAGVDLIALEMMGPGDYALPAVEGARQAGLPLWFGVSVLRLVDDETDYGSLANPGDRDAFNAVLESVGDEDFAAINVMHSHLDEIGSALDEVRRRWPGPLGAYAHVGTFDAPHWRFETVSPDDYLAHAREWVRRGAQLVGGCCGIRPGHISALRRGLPGVVPGDHAGVRGTR